MPKSSSPPGGSDPAALHQRLTDRVIARVHDAGLAVDRRADATLPKRGRRRTVKRSTLSAEAPRAPEQVREELALRAVFLDLGNSYRQYRRRTGAPISPDVREAAYRFRRELDLASLVSVATSLDQLDALNW
jgi:hypothetical protein